MGEKLNKLVNEKIGEIIAKVESFTKDTEKAILLLTACKSNIVNLLKTISTMSKGSNALISDEEKDSIQKSIDEAEALLKQLEE
jgi:hypothetical protein